METALLVGAGASSIFGYPTARGFIEVCLNEPEFTSRLETERFLRRVVDSLPDSHRDMEGVYEAVSGVAGLGGGSLSGILVAALVPGVEAGLARAAVEARLLRGDILNWLSQTYRFPPRDRQEAIRELWGRVWSVLAGLGCPRPYTVITTNYDGIFESLELSGHVEAGFEPKGTYESWNPDRLRRTPRRTVVRLVKLHGSADWGRNRDSGEVIRLPTVTSWANPEYDPVVLPPAEKTIPFMRPYGELFDVFQRACQRADVLVVIGFAFRDWLIRAAVREALLARDRMRLVIFDPNAAGIREEFFDDLMAQVVVVPEPFEESGDATIRRVLESL